MPGRRPVKEGSFGGHFDELVKHFPPARMHTSSVRKPRKSTSKTKSARVLNQKLFDRAIH